MALGIEMEPELIAEVSPARQATPSLPPSPGGDFSFGASVGDQPATYTQRASSGNAPSTEKMVILLSVLAVLLVGSFIAVFLFTSDPLAFGIFIKSRSGHSQVPRANAPPTIRSLNYEQQIAWKKLRREWKKEHPDIKTNYIVICCKLTSESQDWYVSDKITYPFERSLAAVEASASESAARSGVSISVVVDMFSEESPRVLGWYRDKGNGVKKFATAPDEKFASGLNVYLLKLQQDMPNGQTPDMTLPD